MKYRPALESNPKQAVIDLLGHGIDEYNMAKTGITGNTNLTCLVRDEKENVIGGVHGNYNPFGWAYINAIWVAEEYRSAGMGSALLHCIEKEAKRTGCVHSYLNTVEKMMDAGSGPA